MRENLIKELREFVPIIDINVESYHIVYRIDDGYFIDDLTKFSSKHQLHFQRYGTCSQQQNLIYVDSIFPVILADLALDVFLRKVQTIDEYIHSAKSIVVIDSITDAIYFNRKFTDFLEYLIDTHFCESSVCKRATNFTKIVSKNSNTDELVCFTLNDYCRLYDLLKKELILEIDFSESYIVEKEVHLCLKMRLGCN